MAIINLNNLELVISNNILLARRFSDFTFSKIKSEKINGTVINNNTKFLIKNGSVYILDDGDDGVGLILIARSNGPTIGFAFS